MKASDIISRAATTLYDATNVHWPTAELLQWVNDAQKELVKSKPDTGIVTENFTCIAGARQSLPAGGQLLTDVHYNTGSDGLTPGTAIKRRSITKILCDDVNWLAADEVDSPSSFVYDKQADRKTFWLSPPPRAGQQVMISYSKEPAELATINDDLLVDDIYAPTLLQFVLWMAFSKDMQEASVVKAQSAQAAFYKMIGAEYQASLTVGEQA